MNDYLKLVKHLDSSSVLVASELLAGLLNEDDVINMTDFLVLGQHISGDKPIHDPSKESTLLDEGV